MALAVLCTQPAFSGCAVLTLQFRGFVRCIAWLLFSTAKGVSYFFFSSLGAWDFDQEPPCRRTNAQIMCVLLSDVDFRAQSELGLHDQRSGTTQNALECPQLLLSSSAGPRPENRKKSPTQGSPCLLPRSGAIHEDPEATLLPDAGRDLRVVRYACARTRRVLATLMSMDSNMTLAAKLPGCIRESKLACPRSAKDSFL